ncbi:MAG: hypothetical protein KAS32_11095 [Candidatus Peribacteraceae bacterium]|nr:hypothetical protein [Candidatus Peribacteraceae bacterium]
MAKLKCPHCNKIGCVPELAFENVKYYGSKLFHVACTKCKKPIKVSLTRAVVVNSIEESDKQDDDLDF